MSDSTRNTENGAIRTLWTPEAAQTTDAAASVDATDAMDAMAAMDAMPVSDALATAAEPERIDLTAIREKLAAAKGPELWRGLEEVAQTEEFQQFVNAEFPASAELVTDGVSRRNFLKLMGASLALAGVNACTKQPTEKIFPYVKQPEEIIPGKPLFYATAASLDGYALGTLVESHTGRPTKIEGNPEHQASLGATDSITQATVLQLYDPDRSQVISRAGEIRPYAAFINELGVQIEGLEGNGGEGLRLLTGTVTSPTLVAQIEALQARYPEMRWHRYEPVSRDGARAGARLAFGKDVSVDLDISAAEVIVSLGADFLASGPGGVRYARQFADGRRLSGDSTEMNRLYVVEPLPTVTGGKADHRLPLEASRMEDAAERLATLLGVTGAKAAVFDERHETWLSAVAADLKEHRGHCVVIAGDQESAITHAWVHAINARLGNAGKTVRYREPIEAQPVSHRDSLAELTADAAAGKVTTLLILDANPVFDSPADVDFAGAVDTVPFSLHLGLYADETSERCLWHISQAHSLESWSDTRAYDGTVTIVQPLIAPLYGGKTAHEIVAALLGQPLASAHDIVKEHWSKAAATGGLAAGVTAEEYWRRSLHDGLAEGTQAVVVSASVRSGLAGRIAARRREDESVRAEDADDGGFEVVFRPDPHLWDGRFANLAWLQELPRPVTRLVWGNAVLVGARLAEENDLADGDVVELNYRGRSLKGPVWIAAGTAPDTIGLYLGHGRERGGRVADGVGFNAYAVRTSDAPWSGSGASLRKLGETESMASTQLHHSMEGRHLARHGTLQQYEADPGFQSHFDHIDPEGKSLFPEHPYEGYAWGMSIDLNACIGCMACTIACQAENNIPVVGKQEVINGREMHWIRVDRYFEGDLDDPHFHHQPVPCMQCENAPCEVVCPVNATVHSDEGLNDMVYNRCVGTRYCSNNCPYKVRRFNFKLWNDWETEQLKMQRNPDVTVRSRGVMEKCTYCVQRINHKRIEAKREGRDIRDGEIETACQQVCPAEAISFGNINDAEANVSRDKAGPRSYSLLGELGTKPRTTYLASVRNPNPALEPPGESHGGHGGHGSHGDKAGGNGGHGDGH